MTDQYPPPADDALRVIRPAWHMHAACRGLGDGDIFFSYEPGDQAAAKLICATCPVQRDCFLWALRTLELHGVWGGFTSDERVEIRRRQAS